MAVFDVESRFLNQYENKKNAAIRNKSELKKALIIF